MTCFVIAMDKEAAPVVDAMTDVRVDVVSGRKTYSGRMCGLNAAVVVCGVGKTNAAAGTQLALSVLKADRMINMGTAGALSDACAVGETYGISAAVQYDFDLRQLNGTGMGTLDEYDEPYLPLDSVSGYPLRKAATGDRFNDDEEDFRLLTDTFGADIRDMECAAVAHVCRRAGVPVFAFKTITDTAGSGSTTEQFEENLDACLKKLGDIARDVMEKTEGRGGETR